MWTEGPSHPEDLDSPSPAREDPPTTAGDTPPEPRLARALAESVARLEELRAVLERQSAAHAAREAALAAREAALLARLDERGRLIDGLTRHITTLNGEREQERLDLARTILDLESRLAENQARVEALADTRDHLAAELAEITSGRAWKLARLASAARKRLAPRAILPIRPAADSEDPGRQAV